ncbi:MAG: type II toxin-antitoxin system death-on-curing family toxin [Anaerolineae bacterium]|nr:type II toxin-antitoxin system death-on-curing family toxin [Anaerolineae bacterium]
MNSNSAKPIRYLTAPELYQINDEVTGGEALVRDVHLLNSAAARPAIMLFGEAQFPTLVDKAAALLHSLAYHHLFADGNKRTALRAVTLFLERNGYRLTWTPITAGAFILEVAQGKYDPAQIAAYLQSYIINDFA